MADTKTTGATQAVTLAEVGKAGTNYVKTSSQALKLASELLQGHETRHAAALKKVAAIRELLVKTKLIEAGEEKDADTFLSNHESTLDVLANVLESYQTKEAKASAEPSTLGKGVNGVGSGNGEGGEDRRTEKVGRIVLHERRPRGHSEADLRLRDQLLR